MLIYGTTGMISRRLYKHRCRGSICICMCELCGADLWHGQQSKGMVVWRTRCYWTARHSVMLPYCAFFILGNGINKCSPKRRSPVEFLGVQAQRIQKNCCTVEDGSIVKYWGLKLELFWINKGSLYAKYYCNCRLIFWLPYQGRCILNGIFVCLAMGKDRK